MKNLAFPHPALADESYKPHPGDEGLTKREYAAIHLLPSVILADDFGAPAEVLAARAVELADAVLRRAGE